MASWSESEVREAIEAITRRAATDPAFRQKALSDPNAAVEEATGKSVPADVKIRFVEKGDADMVIPLPHPVDETELSDDELEEVAGGSRCGGSCGGSCVLSWG